MSRYKCVFPFYLDFPRSWIFNNSIIFQNRKSVQIFKTIVNPSTPQPEGWDLLRVDPEWRFLPRPKGWGLAPSNGSSRI